MNQIGSNILSSKVQKILNGLQKKINEEASFSDKVKKAQSLWNSKGGKEGKKKFAYIFNELYSLCVYVGICNYCEQSEANDIEHIYPKSFFPELAFNWDNYLLACKQCNSAYKLDQCYILDDNDDVLEVERGNQPLYKTGCFINPKTEYPNTFMILNLLSFKFDLFPVLNKKNINKALITLKIFKLNE